MSYNGAGVFTRLYSWVTEAGLGVKIRSDFMDTDSNDIATGLSNCICRDGQSTISANIPFNSKKITGLGAGTLATDAVNLSQIQSTASQLASAVGGTANAITLTMAPVTTAYATGEAISFVATAVNTSSVTVNIDGLGTKAITKNGTVALVAGDIPNGAMITMRYDGTQFQLINQVTSTQQSFVGGKASTATALTSSSNSIAIDLSLNNDYTHTFTEATTLANPTNILAGQKGRIFLTQHASSPKTLAYGSYYKFAGGTVPTVTATNSALDVLYYDVLDATHIACNLVKAFA